MLSRPLTLTGRVRRCLNLGSYNYLGFAASDEYCTPRVLETMNSYGWGMCSSRLDAGTCSICISSNCLPGTFAKFLSCSKHDVLFPTLVCRHHTSAHGVGVSSG